MGVDTILLAAGTDESPSVESVVDPVVELALAADAAVVVAHALDEDEYESLIERTDASVGDRGGTGYVLDDETVDDAGAFDMLFPTRQYDGATTGEAADELVGQYERIGRIAEAIDGAGVDCRVRGRVGEPAESIQAVADEVDADLIAVGRRERSKAAQALFGSVSRSVIEVADRPVLVVSDDG